MHTLFIYLLKAAISLVIFYAAYRFLFRTETFYRYNRIWLLSTFAASLLLPLLPMPFSFGWAQAVVEAGQGAAPAQDGAAPVLVRVRQGATQGLATVLPWLTAMYALICGSLLIMHGMQLLYVRKLVKLGTTEHDGRYRVVRSAHVQTPFSFCDFIFMPPDDYAPAAHQQILLHEKAHATQRHTWDTLFASLYCCICWFNPFAWIMKKALQLNLEYLADEAVLQKQVPAKDYQYTLVKIGLLQHTGMIVNHFGQSFIKNRITMINKLPSGNHKKWKYLLSLPVTAVVIGLLSAGEAPAVQPLLPVIEQNADQWQDFPGGRDAFARFMAKNIRYPRVDQEKTVTGVVAAQFTVQPDGAVTDIKILKEPAQSTRLGEEVKRVVATMPNFKPNPGGKAVKKQVKVSFKLYGDNSQVIDAEPGVKTDLVVIGYPPKTKSVSTR